jgi:hypothetical protein
MGGRDSAKSGHPPTRLRCHLNDCSTQNPALRLRRASWPKVKLCIIGLNGRSSEKKNPAAALGVELKCCTRALISDQDLIPGIASCVVDALAHCKARASASGLNYRFHSMGFNSP